MRGVGRDVCGDPRTGIVEGLPNSTEVQSQGCGAVCRAATVLRFRKFPVLKGGSVIFYRNSVSFNGIHPAGQEILRHMSRMVRRQDSTYSIPGSRIIGPRWSTIPLLPLLVLRWGVTSGHGWLC